MKPGLLRHPVAHAVLVAAVGLIAYSNTLEAPFQWDDKYDFLAKNPIVKDIGYFAEPSRAKAFGHLYEAFKRRSIGYLSFAVNYRLHGLDVAGYHALNVSIHIANALLLYALVLLTFRTPRMEGSSMKEHRPAHMALFTSLLFVSHPVQTEAVTYIFQRFASLVTFFYLGSMVFYVKWRLRQGAPPSRFWGLRLSVFGGSAPKAPAKGHRPFEPVYYLLSVLFALLAMKTKENALTLPFAAALYEFFFFSGGSKKRLFGLLPLFLTPLVVLEAVFDLSGGPIEGIAGRLEPGASGYHDISRQEYVFTQFRVFVTYIRLLFIPVNQNIDYDYPVYGSFFSLPVALSFLFFISVFAVSVWISRSGKPDLRLVSFGILYFFLALYVESVTFALPTVINEYRVYLPSPGAFLAMSGAAFLIFNRLKGKRAKALGVMFFAFVPLTLSYASYARNEVWGSEIKLWEDTVRKSPRKARAHNNLGRAYGSAGLPDKAIGHFRKAVMLNPRYADAHYNLGVACEDNGLLDAAMENYANALRIEPGHALARLNLGRACWLRGLPDEAVRHFQVAVEQNPHFDMAHYNLGLIYFEKGLDEAARREFETALKINPEHREAARFLEFFTKFH